MGTWMESPPVPIPGVNSCCSSITFPGNLPFATQTSLRAQTQLKDLGWSRELDPWDGLRPCSATDPREQNSRGSSRFKSLLLRDAPAHEHPAEFEFLMEFWGNFWGNLPNPHSKKGLRVPELKKSHTGLRKFSGINSRNSIIHKYIFQLRKAESSCRIPSFPLW